MKEEKREMFQLKITLEGIRPPIWRRVLVPGSTSLSKFHDVLQIVMGWTDSHLHQFECNGELYVERNPDYPSLGRDERQYRLNQLLRKEKDWLRYEYDFGDCWIHKVQLEKKLPAVSADEQPRCLRGKQACPPEDCGGPWGYQELLASLESADHSAEEDDWLEWLGDDFDPEYFSVEEVNEVLAEYWRSGG
jgi:hypothetical protein